jgi:hypothetical protein
MSPIDQLKAVLCDPSGKCCIDGSDEDRAIIDRALQALAQPEQEPVAWMMPDYGDVLPASQADGTGIYNIPLYTAPPRKPWQGLTDDEVDLILWQGVFDAKDIRAIEAKLKEKNGG